MKLWILAAAGLIGLTAANNVAEAQWGERRVIVQPAPAHEAWRVQLAVHAHELSDEANHLAHYLRAIDGMGYLADDAAALSSMAEHFHQSVEAGAPPYQLTDQFRQVRREYRMLIRSLEQAHHVHHSGHFEADWESMERAFAASNQLVQRLETTYAVAPPPYYGDGHGYYQPAPPPRVVYPPRYRYRPMPRRIAPRFEIQFGRR